MSCYIAHLYTDINGIVKSIYSFEIETITYILNHRKATKLYLEVYSLYSAQHIEMTDKKEFRSDELYKLIPFLNKFKLKKYVPFEYIEN